MLEGKVALVTGSSKGIGRAIATEFAKNGCDVVINYKSSESDALEVSNLIKKNYEVNVLVVQADITKEGDREKLIDSVISKFGKLDILVNNAGIAIDKEVEDRTVEDFSKTLSTNLMAPFFLSRLAAKHMLEAKKGKIINISSSSGIDGYVPMSIDYDCSKAALNILTKDLAVQYAPYINVNAVAPGWVNTDINKTLPEDFLNEEKERIWLKRFAEPEEIAKTVVFLASDEANFINGEILKIDGGYR